MDDPKLEQWVKDEIFTDKVVEEARMHDHYEDLQKLGYSQTEIRVKMREAGFKF